ncbi:hypothetical protein B0H21DRAFT_363377 [Amylocystis lapponica]|nr:hypothetical protein B0H21DRAFT_363377 [Amylocystis lapponica]
MGVFLGVLYTNPATLQQLELRTSIEVHPLTSIYILSKMMNLVVSRAPVSLHVIIRDLLYLTWFGTQSLILFGTLQTAMWTWVWSRWRAPSLITGPLPSHIPKGRFGRSRFQVQPAYAHA